MAFSEESDTSVVRLSGLIEGVSSGVEILIENKTGRSYSNLLAQTSCGCLRPVDIDGLSWAANETSRVRFGFLPNTDRFEQSCKLTGNVEGFGRCEIGTLTISGIVAPPVRLSKSAFTLDDVKMSRVHDGTPVKVSLSTEVGVSIDYASVKFGSENSPIRFHFSEDKSSIEFEFDDQVDYRANQVFPLVFPLEFEECQYQFTVPVKLVTEIVEVTPRVLVFRDKMASEHNNLSSEKMRHTKFVVKGNGVQIPLEQIRLGFAKGKHAPDSFLKPTALKCKQVASSVVLIELALEEAEIPLEAEEVVLMTGNVDAYRIPFVLK